MVQKLLTTKDAAEYLNISISTLIKDRMGKAKIPYVKIGPRMIRYKLSTLDEYIQDNLQS